MGLKHAMQHDFGYFSPHMCRLERYGSPQPMIIKSNTHIFGRAEHSLLGSGALVLPSGLVIEWIMIGPALHNITVGTF